MGGDRDPLKYWDFYDTPDTNNVRDGVVNISDIMRVVTRYGARGNPGGSPLVGPIPEPRGYHPAFDRGRRQGPNLWDLAPPDGGISLMDMMGVMAQFGHRCI